MFNEGRNEAIPLMPLHQLADIVGNAAKSVKSQSRKKSFKHTLFLLPADGPRDEEEGGKRLIDLIVFVPSFQQLREKYQFVLLESLFGIFLS